MPAGNNNIGDVDVLSLPALPAGNNNIGDVDVLSVPAPLNVTGSGTQAAALRATLATDSPLPAQVTEDAAAATDPTGLHMMARRRNSPSTETSADGDVTAVNVSAAGALYVEILGGTTKAAVSSAGALQVAMRDGAGDSCMDDANNSLRVSIVSGAGSGGTAM
ncbi:MAG TPA: hypothetical protein VGK73_35090, partial [Polyangiaceae bacterium]